MKHHSGPIKAQHHYYKSILPSRLDKIHYRVKITPNESTELEPVDGGEKKEIVGESFIKEGDIFINKLIDNCFYINEGVRYFLIYQIVDNATYGTENAVSLKSLLMPITIKKHEITATPEFGRNSITIPSYETLLFSKCINPLLYYFVKDAYNDIANYKVQNTDNTLDEWMALRDTKIIDRFNKFYKTHFVFKDKLMPEMAEGNYVFRISNENYICVPEKDIEKPLTLGVLGCLLDMKNETRKKKISISYDQLISPWFWVNTMAGFFTKNTDYLKRFNKIRTMLISLNRLIDETTRKVLNLKDDDKENTLTIMRYIIGNFEKLMNADS